MTSIKKHIATAGNSGYNTPDFPREVHHDAVLQQKFRGQIPNLPVPIRDIPARSVYKKQHINIRSGISISSGIGAKQNGFYFILRELQGDLTA